MTTRNKNLSIIKFYFLNDFLSVDVRVFIGKNIKEFLSYFLFEFVFFLGVLTFVAFHSKL